MVWFFQMGVLLKQSFLLEKKLTWYTNMFHGQNNFSDSNLSKINLLKKNRKYYIFIYMYLCSSREDTRQQLCCIEFWSASFLGFRLLLPPYYKKALLGSRYVRFPS